MKRRNDGSTVFLASFEENRLRIYEFGTTRLLMDEIALEVIWNTFAEH